MRFVSSSHSSQYQFLPMLTFFICFFSSLSDTYGQSAPALAILEVASEKRADTTQKGEIEDGSFIVLFDRQLEDGDNSSSIESASPLLQASSDVFARVSSFDWGAYFFNPRGYDSRYAKVLINGVEMNHPLRGRPIWRDWGGLNGVMRYPRFVYGIEAHPVHHGSVASVSNFDTRASTIRAQKILSASYTNRNNYQYRLIGTYATGVNSKGWAFVLAGGLRIGEDPIASSGRDGGFLRSYSLFAALEKTMKRHSINLSFMGVYDQRGISSNPMTQEVKDLFGVNYNPYWGYQNGKKRNERTRHNFAPTTQLVHEWKMSDHSQLKTTASLQIANRGYSRMARYNQPSTNPVYYKYLPSYQLSQGNDESSAPALQSNYLLPTYGGRINWDYIYRVNSALASQGSAPGYVLATDTEEGMHYAFVSTFYHKFSDKLSLHTTVSYHHHTLDIYRKVADLLGGRSFMDIDPFNNTKNNLGSGSLVAKGSRYDYSALLNRGYFYGNIIANFSSGKWSGSLGFNVSHTSMWREGKFQNELYASSYGKSDILSFLNYSSKLSSVYKIGGRHYLKLNGMYGNEAPTLQEAFPNSRYQNTHLEDMKSVQIISGDISYLYRSSKLDVRATFFYTEMANQMNVSYFFVQSNTFDAFTAEVLSGMDARRMGGELGIQVSLTSSLTLNVAATYGEHRYTNNPTVTLMGADLQEISGVKEGQQADLLSVGEALLKNYRLSTGPQAAFHLGIQYVSSTYWRLGISGNHLRNNYISISNLQRTSLFSENPNTNISYSGYTPEAARALLRQERFPDAFYINLNIGKSWRVRGYLVGVSLNVTNALNNTNIITGGYEQSRYADFQLAQEDANREKPLFGNRRWYAQGINFFLNLYIRF